MIALADDPALQAMLQSAAAASFEGHLFRVIPGSSVVHNITFEHLWAGGGTGRCNPVGVERIYLSLERETAEAEFVHWVRKAGL
jgi:hypothetical protein